MKPEDQELKPNLVRIGTVVQLNGDTKNPMFKYCMMTVTDVRAWGAVGYVQALGENGKMGGQAYYRARWDEFEIVGSAVFIVGEVEQ